MTENLRTSQPSNSGSQESTHVHEWQPNGTVEVDRAQRSPSSTWDDQLWTDVVSVAVCRCGKLKKERVGTKNVRRRGDDLRRGRAS